MKNANLLMPVLLLSAVGAPLDMRAIAKQQTGRTVVINMDTPQKGG